jgi:hypothetical protein
MSSSPHAKAYEAIWTAVQKDPNAVISSLCKKYKVSYQSYNNWVKRHKKQPVVTPERPTTPTSVIKDNPNETIVVRIPLSSVVTAIRYHRKEIVIPRERVLEAMSQEDKAKVATAVGLLAMEHGPGESTDGLATDDGELTPSKRNPFSASKQD